MAVTPIYGLPYEAVGDQPGVSLRAPGPILAEQVEDELVRVDDDIAAAQADIAQLQGVVQPTTGWAIYTPVVTGGGSATFTTQTGRWRRVGFLTVHHVIYLVVDTAGSGGTTLQVDAPTGINRATRQTAIMSIEGAAGGGGGNRLGYVSTLTGGATLERWDRLRMPDGVDSHLDNMVGSDLAAGMILVIQGTYQEEEAT